MADIYSDIISGAHALETVIGTFNSTGAKRPKPVAEALDYRDAMQAKFANRKPPAAPDLVAAALDAVDREVDDIAADPDVRGALLRIQYGAMPGLWDQLQTRLLVGVRQVCTAHADAIVKAWAAPFDKAAGQLHDAHHVLGDNDLDEGKAVLRLGPNGAKAWSEASAALGTVATIVAGWRSLHGFTTGRLADVAEQLILAQAEPEDVLGDRQLWRGQHARPAWELVAAGVTLDLGGLERPRQQLAAVELLERERAAGVASDRQAASSFAKIL